MTAAFPTNTSRCIYGRSEHTRTTLIIEEILKNNLTRRLFVTFCQQRWELPWVNHRKPSLTLFRWSERPLRLFGSELYWFIFRVLLLEIRKLLWVFFRRKHRRSEKKIFKKRHFKRDAANFCADCSKKNGNTFVQQLVFVFLEFSVIMRVSSSYRYGISNTVDSCKL